jgi:hypothetical protein
MPEVAINIMVTIDGVITFDHTFGDENGPELYGEQAALIATILGTLGQKFAEQSVCRCPAGLTAHAPECGLAVTETVEGKSGATEAT